MYNKTLCVQEDFVCTTKLCVYRRTLCVQQDFVCTGGLCVYNKTLCVQQDFVSHESFLYTKITYLLVTLSEQNVFVEVYFNKTKLVITDHKQRCLLLRVDRFSGLLKL